MKRTFWLLGLFAVVALGGLVWDSGHIQASDSLPDSSADTPPASDVSCPKAGHIPPHTDCDRSSSEATHSVFITSVGLVTCGAGDLTGPTRISRTAADADDVVDTEIVTMLLTGNCGGIPITLRESPSLDSTGKITEQSNPNPGMLDFPADSFFDVYFELDTPLGTLHNNLGNPARMKCELTDPPGLPPHGCEYQLNLTDPPPPAPPSPVRLYNEAGDEVGYLVQATHSLLPPTGGITELTDQDVLPLSASGSSGGFGLALYAALAGGIAAAVAAAVAGGWYARRRWLR